MQDTVFSGRYTAFEFWSEPEALAALWESHLAAAAAVRPALPALGDAARIAAAALAKGGRLAYAGAGTPGCLARADGLELPGTFGIERGRLLFFTPGGLEACDDLSRQNEDDAEAGEAEARAAGLGPHDALIAVSASGSTPYTLGVLRGAAAAGSPTIALVGRVGSPLGQAAHRTVLLETGPEVLGGSTRLGAGTAQKIALGIFSTLLARQLGLIYEGLMIGVRPDNEKLRQRAISIVARIGGCPRETALQALIKTDWSAREAALVVFGHGPQEARRLLSAAGGDLRSALAHAAGIV